MLLTRIKHTNHSTQCQDLANKLPLLYPKLHAGLSAVAQPAVLMQSSCAGWKLLQNFLCGLERQKLDHIFKHVLVAAADDCTVQRLTESWPQVRFFSSAAVFGATSAELAATTSNGYAAFGVAKVFLPFAAASMGFSVLMQDIDIVWHGDVLAHVTAEAKARGGDMFVMSDMPLHDTTRYPCGALYWEGRYTADVVAKCEAQGREMCFIHQLNGGIQFIRPTEWSLEVLKRWLVRCPHIVRDRNDQPHMQAALQVVITEVMNTSVRTACRYQTNAEAQATLATPNAVSSSPLPAAAAEGARASESSARLVVLNSDRFVIGRPDEVWLAASRTDRLPLLTHVNYRSTWAQKCTGLAQVGGLHLHGKAAGQPAKCTATGELAQCVGESPKQEWLRAVNHLCNETRDGVRRCFQSRAIHLKDAQRWVHSALNVFVYGGHFPEQRAFAAEGLPFELPASEEGLQRVFDRAMEKRQPLAAFGPVTVWTTRREEINHASPAGCNAPFLTWLKHTYPSGGVPVDVLDVGGGIGSLGVAARRAAGRHIDWDCIDVVASSVCKGFDGHRLTAYANASKDFVIFNYVLHHAAEHTISLLREARRVSRKYVVIVEDLLGTTKEQTLMEHGHEWHGVYRAREEWLALGELLGMRLVQEQSPPTKCVSHYQVPRGFYVFERL